LIRRSPLGCPVRVRVWGPDAHGAGAVEYAGMRQRLQEEHEFVT
jgi:hypothetical protein